MSNLQIKTTERGWKGPFILAEFCRFSRNTLIEYGELRVVVSSVGNMKQQDCVEPIRSSYYYETNVFVAEKINGYWEANVNLALDVDQTNTIDQFTNVTDQQANEQHDRIVLEFINKLLLKRAKDKEKIQNVISEIIPYTKDEELQKDYTNTLMLEQIYK